MILNGSIYDKNLEVLKKRYKDIAKRLDHDCGGRINCEIADARDGTKSCLVSIDNSRMYIHSAYKPLEEAKKWFENLKVKENTTVFVFGYGLGYHIQQVSRNLGPQNRVVVYEPSIPIFKMALCTVDQSDVLECENVYLLVGAAPEEIKNAVCENIDWMSAEDAIYKSLPVYDRLFSRESLDFIKAVKTGIDFALIKRDTILTCSEKWTKNFILNLPSILESSYVTDLKGIFEGKPAVIVSAGPSLSKNVKLLEKVKGKAVIICVDTALRVLKAHHIEPDIVVCVDADASNYKHFEGLDYVNIPLLYCSTAYWEILYNHPRKKLLFTLQDEFIVTLLKKYNKKTQHFRQGGSVSHFALDFALMSGADPVIFIGQDLAFTDQKTHADGTAYQKNMTDAKEDNGYVTVEGIDGNQIPTSRMLYAFLVWFEAAVRMDTSKRLYINSTEGGANIKGMISMPFDLAVMKYCTYDLKELEDMNEIVRQNRVFDSKDKMLIIEEFESMLGEIENLKNICREAMDLMDQYGKAADDAKDGSSNIPSEIKKKERLSRELAGKMRILDWIMDSIRYKEYLLNNQSEVKTDRVENTVFKSRFYFQSMLDMADFLHPLLADCIRRMKFLLK